MFPSTFYYEGRPQGMIDLLNQRLSFYDHFMLFNDEDWVVVADGTPTLLVDDLSGGWLKIGVAAANDNDEVYISTGEVVAFTADKPVYIGCSLKLTEANVDDANWIFGLTDQGGANTLLDNGAGPPANYNGAVLFKVDGTMKIFAESSKAAAQSTLASGSAPTFTSGTAVELGIYWDGVALHFLVDGVEVHTVTDSTYFSQTDLMTPTFGCKNGGTNVETLKVDWWIYDQKLT